ncbi:FAD/FMN-containing dehydrogenase [Pseudonocardia ammonioxydans]|uniref:Delta(24)-sterol reductase n=1 Tax=Pseudonocardia ammonioxydans TaxID=260086 RepID=A0A1I4VPA3_PSUAM|nr:FAD-binding oxidoreductase [Pseudonocardia ammonioxydans]SFN02953.1 FAD/FMN-containing dehydrogenase [Pseudonocardia ammonioxydans]
MVTSVRSGSRVAHDRAVEELRRARTAAGRVQLGKPSSNLFRFGDRDTGRGARRLDTSALDGVLSVDPAARPARSAGGAPISTAEVQGMATYETIVDATLAHGLMPLVVPQLKTITLGGAVTGLGVESTSFRHGLPHESVLEMDVLTPAGDLLHVTPDGEHADLFAAFPNSYGTLGYAVRLVVELQPVRPFVELTHHRYPTADAAATAIEELSGSEPDFLDGVVFGPGEQYLTSARFVDAPMPGARVSDYTGREVFYRSLQRRPVDHLTAHDYIWRWDPDWFWCSRAFGVQHPLVRRFWPRRYRRSDVYRRLVALDQRFGASNRVRVALGGTAEEMVVQDVEVPVERLAEFLEFFHEEVGIAPVWLCPMRLRGERSWPLYPMTPGRLYVNVGFWSSVAEHPGDRWAHNRRIEQVVAELGGHKSLYSTVHYGEDEFWAHYNGDAYRAVKQRYDPDGRAPDLYRKVTGR